MVIKNQTKNTILSDNALEAISLKEKTFGLLLKKKGTAMIFQTRFGIHTFFMKYAIDVLVLDENYKIVTFKTNIKQNNIYLWNPKYNRIIELPAGKIKETYSAIGDQIRWDS